jgi:RNA polymerase sigma-70 factor (ECF subfamily)
VTELAAAGHFFGERNVTSKAQGLPTRMQPPQEQPDPRDVGEVSFTQLYEENFDFVWRSIRMLGVPADAADDAAQDVFLVAHRRLADFEGRSLPRTWLFAIALRVVSDYRRSRRRKMRLLDEVMHTEPQPARTPFDAAVGSERRDVLLSALDALSEDQRAVFVLADIEELSAPEIASALEVNLNTVYSRLRSARKTMSERLTQLTAAPETGEGAS